MTGMNRVLALLYERRTEGATAREAADTVGVKYNTCAKHLQKLEREGWATSLREATGKPGGAKRYFIRQEGRR